MNFPTLIVGIGIGLSLTRQGREWMNDTGNFILQRTGFPLPKGDNHASSSREREDVSGDTRPQA